MKIREHSKKNQRSTASPRRYFGLRQDEFCNLVRIDVFDRFATVRFGANHSWLYMSRVTAAWAAWDHGCCQVLARQTKWNERMPCIGVEQLGVSDHSA